MPETKWEEYAQLVLRGLESCEGRGKDFEKRISQLENQMGNLMTVVKIITPLIGALILDALRNFFGG